MQSKRLAQWLQDHTDMLGTIDQERDSAFYVALYEGIIDVALRNDTRMVDSVLESSAAHAVAIGRELTDLLGVHQQMRQRIWNRIGDEVDPEPAFVMLSALDAIFVHVIRVTIDSYQETSRLAMAAKSVEISRLYTESEQKVMEYATEVSRANRELLRLEQAKTDFISIAAHELKTPLTLIQGYVNILKELEINQQVTSLVKGISRGSERMNNIIEDMLDLSAMDMRRMRLMLQRSNLKTTIQLVVAQAHHTLQDRQQTLETINLEQLPDIEADDTRLYQIFKQLVSNAIKYTPDGGHITITGKLIPAKNNSSEKAKITFQDTGIGIAPEDKENIFRKFYRVGDSARHSTGETKFMGAGPGLGLAIVKGLVEAHGGQISVESPGFDMQNYPGSTFTVILPTKAAPQPDIETKWVSPESQLPES